MKYAASAVPTQAKKELDAQLDRMERIEADQMADKLLLPEWGKWSRQTGINLGYPACLLPFCAKGSWEPDLRKYIADISDETGMKIEDAVTALPDLHRAVILAIYKLQIKSSRLPHVFQISERQVSAYRNQAIGVLWEKLNGKLKTR